MKKRERKLKQYIIQDIHSNIYNYTCFTRKEARDCFDAENGKDNFGLFIEVIKNLLMCPNCKQNMVFVGQVEYEEENYDRWDCEDCSHIIVLDFRGTDK